MRACYMNVEMTTEASLPNTIAGFWTCGMMDVCCLKSRFVTVTLTKLQRWLCRETMALFWVEHDRKGSRLCAKMRCIYLILMCMGLTMDGITVVLPWTD